VAPTARDQLEDLIERHTLPADTRDRVRSAIAVLVRSPEAGQVLGGRWTGYRRLVGPWGWMQIVYEHDEPADQVNVVTIEDTRSATAGRTA
jgi:plasmid stabilization system protein ParE